MDGWNPKRYKSQIDPWPRTLNLQNFSYNHLHGWSEGEWAPITARPSAWFVKRLGRQKQFSPQPYEHCAKVLRAAGAPNKANKVLYACKERERKQAAGWRKLGLLLNWAFIGHGIGWRYLVSVGWAVLLIAIGYFLLGGCVAGEAMCTSQKIAFNLDMFLPIIELFKNHAEILKDIPDPWPRWWFYFMKISGYGLAGLIIARLAGVGSRAAE